MLAGDFVGPAKKNRHRGYPVTLSASPLRIPTGAAGLATWTVRLVRTEYPVQVSFPRSKVLSAPLPHTSAKQQNLARSNPLFYFLFLSFSPHPTDLPNFFFHDLLESGEEGKTAPTPPDISSRLSLQPEPSFPASA